MEDEFPHVPKELVEHLDRIYPDECPSLLLPDREVWFRAGQASVVRRLIAQLELQNENILAQRTINRV
jgi:hypothetical protein